MAWDIRIDPATGDLVFDAAHDLLGVMGTELVNQRILTRCKIPRGSFKMDEDGTLGSDLYKISAQQGEIQNEEAEAAITVALEPMEDISLGDIEIEFTEDNQRFIRINWTNASALGEPGEEGEEVTIAYVTPTTETTA